MPGGGRAAAMAGAAGDALGTGLGSPTICKHRYGVTLRAPAYRRLRRAPYTPATEVAPDAGGLFI